ncbi:hypothetical protein SGFS_045850 [Streptomyces graminofaciens]|uniref:OmpR/PhoB-type domain-containing protein n=1 Tax=Streptomyces graminofaciens TaxID=68212 RepID=A0ABN5VJU0_9ACTN|nr:BTAD domain-containing putative transcriptional regulator [Streptomyces graminofaciens]BBC33291.1 hypothetical protein SGFS_045850 [Streptomyces graminofaciens]
MTEFLLLGPLELKVSGGVVEVGPPQRRTLLAALLVDAGRPVPLETLIDRVWGEEPPDEARASLYSHVARIRRTLAEGTTTATGAVPRLLRRAGGYLLDVAPDRVDLHRFRGAVEQAADPQLPYAKRALLLREACGLWRGEPFAGLPGAWAARTGESWRQRYLDAVVLWAHAELRCGNHAAVTGRLAELVAEYPLVEPLTSALMRALGASGRAPEALARYAELRARLAEELGTDPGPEARRAHQLILRGEVPGVRGDSAVVTMGGGASDVGVVASGTAAAPPEPKKSGPGRPLVGRDAELAVLERAVTECAEGFARQRRGAGPRVLELAGEPGIGKTRLLDELAERARQQGLLTLTGRSVQYDRATPYGAFVDALDDQLAATGTVAGLPPAVAHHLATVFPSLGLGLGLDGDGTSPGTARAERYWLHGAMRSLLETLAGPHGLVLTLDDLHWADEGTVELIDHLLRHPPRAPVLLALAHRPRQLPPRLSTALSRSRAEHRSERLELGPLSSTDAARLYGEGLGATHWQQLYRASSGNPLYLEALARPRTSRALTTGPPALPLTDIADLPSAVRDALLAELEGVSPQARRTARAAAVLGDSFTAETAAAVAYEGGYGGGYEGGGDVVLDGEPSPADSLASLDELAAHDLIRPADADTPGRFRFRHPLVRAAVYEGAGAGWRIGAHARAARYLAATGAPLTTQAFHVQRSAQPGDRRAADLLARAARTVLTVAPATAAHWTAEALRLLGEEGRQRPDLWFQQATALGTAGRLRDSRELLRTLRSLLPVRAAEDRVQVTVSLATMEWMLGDYDEAVRLLRGELTAQDGPRPHDGHTGPALPRLDHSGTPYLEAALAAVAQRTDDFSAALHWSERALQSAERSGDPAQAATARGLLALASTSTGHHAQALHHLNALCGALDAPGDDRRHGDGDDVGGGAAGALGGADTAGDDEPQYMDSLVLTGWTEFLQARYASALRHLDRGVALSRRTGNSMLLTDLFAASAYVNLQLGDLDEAARCADAALEAASFVGSDEASSFATAVRAAVQLWRGDIPGALKTFQESGLDRHADENAPEPTTIRAAALGVLSHTLLLSGDPESCVRTMVRSGGGPALPRFEAPVRPLWYAVLTSAELARGNVTAAADWAARSAAATDPEGPLHQQAFTALSEAEVHLARRAFATAAHHAARAATTFATCRMPLYEAISHITAGTALTSLPDRFAEAGSHLDRARALARRSGAYGLLAWADHVRAGLPTVKAPAGGEC